MPLVPLRRTIELGAIGFAAGSLAALTFERVPASWAPAWGLLAAIAAVAICATSGPEPPVETFEFDPDDDEPTAVAGWRDRRAA